MSAILGSAVTGAGGGAYTVNNSLRFRQSASAYLSRTPSVTSNQTTWTWSGWVKRGQISPSTVGYQNVLFAGMASTPTKDNWTKISFLYDDTMRIGARTGGTDYLALVTTQVFRDPSAWYHVVVAIDTTQATSSNRAKLYINGSQVTAFSTATYPSQNYTMPYVNAASSNLFIGRYLDNSYEYLDGYQTEINFIDGQALTASSFGETNASTGVWQPKAYSGSYGTNGFYLKFSDIATTSASNAGLGKDFSGNSNYFVTNNISVTSGVTYDAMTDSPTPASATVGNFCVINPLDNYYMGGTISDGNLKILSAYSSNTYIRGTQGVSSGKWYFEATFSAASAGNEWCGVGWASKPSTSSSDNTGSLTYVSVDGTVGGVASGTTYTVGDTIGVMIDLDNNLVYFSKNGTLINSGNGYSITAASATTTGFYYPALADYDATGTKTWIANFGQRPFAYTPPTGFKRLETYNLPTPTIGASSTTLANKYFDVSLYTGNGTGQSITNSGSFQPDLVWIKDRSQVATHVLTDAVRGTTKQLFSNLTNAEQTNSTYVTSFNSNGFTVGVGTSGTGVVNNTTPDSFVGWQWKGSNTTTSNTSGTITSTVSSNTTSGFSVVTYTGNLTSGATVGHGLGATPKMIILKDRNVAGTSWVIYNVNFTSAAYVAYLNSNSAQSSSVNMWNSTAPNSTTFTIGNDTWVNRSSGSYVAYCFAEVAGFSKFGIYIGNGSSDGPFIYCGFRPRFIMVKRFDGVGSDWYMYDTARSPYNVGNQTVAANLTAAESAYASTNYFDFLSNGFKIRQDNSSGYNNASGGSYIYMAFAENPFNYSLAR